MCPLVSIITPFYNCEKYFSFSIKSILSQTFSDFELILADDGGSDGSRKIAEIFADTDKRIKLLGDGKENFKIPKRRNIAIQAACGKYICIHDGDDISLSDRLRCQVNFLERNSNVFCVGSHAIKIDKNNDIIGKMDYPPETHNEIFQMVCKQCMNPMIDPTTVFLRDIFLKLGGYTLEKEIYTVPDFDIWLRAILSGYKFANIKKPLIQYRENPNGMTGKHKREMINAHMIVWRNFMKDLNRSYRIK